MVYAYIVKSAPRSIPISVHYNWLLACFLTMHQYSTLIAMMLLRYISHCGLKNMNQWNLYWIFVFNFWNGNALGRFC